MHYVHPQQIAWGTNTLAKGVLRRWCGTPSTKQCPAPGSVPEFVHSKPAFLQTKGLLLAGDAPKNAKGTPLLDDS